MIGLVAGLGYLMASVPRNSDNHRGSRNWRGTSENRPLLAGKLKGGEARQRLQLGGCGKRKRKGNVLMLSFAKGQRKMPGGQQTNKESGKSAGDEWPIIRQVIVGKTET